MKTDKSKKKHPEGISIFLPKLSIPFSFVTPAGRKRKWGFPNVFIEMTSLKRIFRSMCGYLQNYGKCLIIFQFFDESLLLSTNRNSECFFIPLFMLIYDFQSVLIRDSITH